MTRTHCLARLLEHGALTLGEIRDITGWKLFRCNNVLIRLRRQERVVRVNLDGQSKYALAGRTYGRTSDGCTNELTASTR